MECREEKEFVEIVSNLAIALYNVGTEEEFFGNNDRALIHYSNACTVSEDNLGS